MTIVNLIDTIFWVPDPPCPPPTAPCWGGGGGALQRPRGGGGGKDALDGKGPQRWFQRRLEEVAKAVAGGYCRLQMTLSLALAIRGTVAGHRLGALEGGGGGTERSLWYR